MDLVILIGLQASGKSTFYRTFFAGTHELVSKDLMRNNHRPERRQRQLIEEFLALGRSVVVDNTNPSVDDRAGLIELGRAAGARIIGYYFESNLTECELRNRNRTGKAQVPDVALWITNNKLKKPSRAEGFEQLHFVRIVGEGRFQVTDLVENGGIDEAR